MIVKAFFIAIFAGVWAYFAYRLAYSDTPHGALLALKTGGLFVGAIFAAIAISSVYHLRYVEE